MLHGMASARCPTLFSFLPISLSTHYVLNLLLIVGGILWYLPLPLGSSQSDGGVPGVQRDDHKAG